MKRGLTLAVLVGALAAVALPAGSAVTTVAGVEGRSGFAGDGGDPSKALLNQPSQAAVPDNVSGLTGPLLGSLYIADTANNRVRRLETVAATGATIGLNPVGASVCTSQTAAVMPCPAGQSVIRTVGGTGHAGKLGDGGHPLAAEFNQPNSVCVASGLTMENVFVADTGNNAIRRISFPKTVPASVSISTSGVAVNAGTPVVTTVAGVLGKAGFVPANGAKAATDVLLNHPLALTCSNEFPYTGSSVVRVADTDNNRVLEFTVDGAGKATNPITVAGTGVAGYSGDGGFGAAAKLNHPRGLATCGGGVVGRELGGGMAIADTGNNRIRLARQTSDTVVVTPNHPDPMKKVEAPARAYAIQALAGTGTAGLTGDGGDPLQARINQPWGMRCAWSETAGHTVSFADSGNNRIRKITTQVQLQVFGGGFGGISLITYSTPRTIDVLAGHESPRLRAPKGLGGPELLPYVADAGNQVIRKIS